MKKLSTSVSPFLMLVIPVLIFTGLSFTFNEADISTELSSSFSTKQVETNIITVSEKSIIKFLLKK